MQKVVAEGSWSRRAQRPDGVEMDHGVTMLEGEVRELIRRRGLDPARDHDGVRQVVAAAIADYDERSVLGLGQGAP
jgi:hypothetical protein